MLRSGIKSCFFILLAAFSVNGALQAESNPLGYDDTEIAEEGMLPEMDASMPVQDATQEEGEGFSIDGGEQRMPSIPDDADASEEDMD